MGFLQKLIVFSFLVALLAALWYALAPKKVNIPKSSDLKHWWGRGAPKITEDAVVEDYQLRYEPDAVDDLKKRLSRTRYFGSLEDVDWDYGVNTKYVKHIIDYWLKSFSWEKQLNEINQYKHFRVNVDGIKIHFIHVKNTQAKVKPVIPVLLIHGWPGSFYEFYKLIPILMKEDLNFELVIPSLPGYGFSEAAEQKGLDQFYAGVILDKLMKKLGYNHYYAQGGDWGGFISKLMAIYFPRSECQYLTKCFTTW